MIEARKKSLDKLYELLHKESFESLKDKYDLYIKHHPTEKIAILHYGIIDDTNKGTDIDSCRGLIIETFPPYKIISHGFDRFLTKKENINTTVDIKKITVKEDGSLMFVFKYNDKFQLATMYDFADNILPLSGSKKTYSELFFEIIGNVSLDKFALDIFNQFEKPDQILTLCFEMCSLENHVIRPYPIPKLYLLAVFGGKDGLEEFHIPDDIVMPQNVELVKELVFEKNVMKISEINDKLLNYCKDNMLFEGIVILTSDFGRIKLKNPYYKIHHKLKYYGFNKCTPELMVPLIFDNIDDIVIKNVVDALPHDKIFIENQLKKRRDNYKQKISENKIIFDELVNYVAKEKIIGAKELIDKLTVYNATKFKIWKSALFNYVKHNDKYNHENEFKKTFLSNMHNIFTDYDCTMLNKTHSNCACKMSLDYNPPSESENPDVKNDGLSNDPHTCFCGSKMNLTELRTQILRYRYCHCNQKEPYGFLTYLSWTHIMMCSNPTCLCTHEASQSTLEPYGIPASTYCKNLRLQIHEMMDKSGLSKEDCYKKIMNITGKTEDEAHMAKFGISDCIKVLKEF